MSIDHSGLTVIDRDTCMQLLAKTPVGRIVYTSGALPVVQPVNYTLDDDSIIVRTSSRSKLAAAGRREVVAFEIDEIDHDGQRGWSVLVTGRATEISDPAELARVTTLGVQSWLPTQPERYVRISCEIITGRAIRPPTDSHDGRA